MFNGRTILITGAASGLGRAWAEGFNAEGATVVAADINGEELKKVPARFHLTVDVAQIVILSTNHNYPSQRECCSDHFADVEEIKEIWVENYPGCFD